MVNNRLCGYNIVREGEGLSRFRAGLVSSVWALLLFVALFGVMLNVPVVKGDSGTIYIRADGSVDPPDAPLSTVDNVTYTFTGNIGDSLVVERDNIVVDGVGYILQGPGSGNGIDLSSRSNVTSKNTNIKDFSYGILLSESSNISITENNITNNRWDGIGLWNSRCNSINGNHITNNSGTGIELTGLYGSSNNSIAGTNMKLYESLHCVTTGERTEKILDIFMMLAGEKISHLYLGWVSNPDLVKDYWDLDSERFLAIDVNIKRVSHNIGLCAWSNTSVIRAHLHQLLDELGMDDSKDAKKLEMAFLYVGQQYCKESNQTQCKQTECPFYPS